MNDCLAEKIKENSKSIVSIYFGKDVTEDNANELSSQLSALVGNDVEINVYEGGQPVYYYIISAE